ncbi:MAG: hypothetical protein A3C93_00835 [Candidatus Lloydbacteria bacterium RIFCSPHIGHO2_02_FULL_54_17]|uniref:Serine protease n=1 Tax=Candidatus Lloydbacteria bacterium RIFCSPHIGHO2_02_FULL_54_17 TaxID=1798664 RepID=A0A1G2DEX1_9BACT|nr:MAG: hypothetical protein A2762_06275 [Candidatus Lloydbacteria bacterium RIFCSPHIGHO2_01_FULL_54_11]OGZ12185.1 MAG: hypothetical protein A3C93_00835 [Candidatus Lloydbacteria bacterium RIFCSPHIGHO2_02_FULL_54_17]OGZ12976.1 MAG: hypothetical protein A2948_01280 [Candidatus Lloydbacteria bacterium RIFCSPLOWO2_01_FULL_54_18]OGZ15845.1 MAG: hypothetical protein A3H76_01805 [Candidatus Lloydbacteria bacterium RIFCSPLOWO2_02_FULL_54_12]
MDARRALVVLGCIALLGAAPLNIAHESAIETERDLARNHLIEEIVPAVYTLKTNFKFRKQGETTTYREANSSGTAFGVTDDGLVMTAFHVVQAPVFNGFPNPSYAPPGKWSYTDGEEATGTYTLIAKDGTKYQGEIVALEPDADLAILSIAKTAPGKKFPFIVFERDPLTYRHDGVVSIGAPFGIEFTVTSGIISNPTRVIGDRIFIQTDAMVHPGNSGGPLILLRNHRVVGVIDQIYSRANFGIGIGFAIPASVAGKFLDETLARLEKERKQPTPAQ